jgi:hypothetical protein
MLGSLLPAVKLSANGVRQAAQGAGAARRVCLGTRADEQTNGSDTGRARGGDVPGALNRDSTDRKDRHRYRPHDGPQPLQADAGTNLGLGEARENCSSDDVVGARSGCRFRHTVHGPPDQEWRWRKPPCRCNGDRIAAQMDAVSTACQRYVNPVVDHHAGCAAARDGEQVQGERCKIGGREVAFAKMNEVDARLDGVPHLLEKTVTNCRERRRAWHQTASIGHETELHE